MKKILISIFILTIVVAGGLFLDSQKTSASTTDNITGWAWSGNVGWISMNCKTGGSSSSDICFKSNYGVNLNTDGTLTGYAWSDNVGWIKFGGLSGFPVHESSVAQNAQVNFSTGQVSGWVRVCGGTINGNCDSMAIPTDKTWDGWISLSGTKNTSPDMSGAGGVTYKSDGAFVGFAWGTNVMGWVDFSGVIGPVNELTFQVYRTASGIETAGGSTTIGPGETATLVWSSPGLSSPCIASAKPADFDWNSSTAPEISEEKREKIVMPIQTTVYELQCKDSSGKDYQPGGVGVWPSVQVDYDSNISKLTLKASPSPVSSSKAETTLTWSGSKVTACKASAIPPVSNTEWADGTDIIVSETPKSTAKLIPVPQNPTTYYLKCIDSIYGTPVEAQDSVSIGEPDPVITSFFPTPSKLPISGGDITLEWASKNTTFCEASYNIPGSLSVGIFSGEKEPNGSEGPFNMKKQTTYKLECFGINGKNGPSDTETVTVRVGKSTKDGEGGVPKIIEL